MAELITIDHLENGVVSENYVVKIERYFGLKTKIKLGRENHTLWITGRPGTVNKNFEEYLLPIRSPIDSAEFRATSFPGPTYNLQG